MSETASLMGDDIPPIVKPIAPIGVEHVALKSQDFQVWNLGLKKILFICRDQMDPRKTYDFYNRLMSNICMPPPSLTYNKINNCVFTFASELWQNNACMLRFSWIGQALKLEWKCIILSQFSSTK